MNECIVVPHNGLGDQINTISMCIYLSGKYNKVYHVCKENYCENIKLFYRNNMNIIVYSLDTDYGENFFTDELFGIVKHIYLLGTHAKNPFIKSSFDCL